MLIKFTYVDSITGVSMLAASCANGPALPAVPGIVIDFSNESEWPCAAPIFYGHCDTKADPTQPGVIDVLTQEVFDAARSAEMARREVCAATELAARRAAKNEEINAERERRTFNSFEHAGKTISCDTLSRSDIDGINGFVALNGAFPDVWPGVWKCADNTYLTISTIDEWKAFYGSMVSAGSALYARAQELKAALALAKTTEEVAAVVR